MEKSLQRARLRTTDSEYFRRLWGVAAPGSKALALVDDNSSSRGVGWRRFMGPRCLLGKVGHSLGVWRERRLQPDEYRWRLDVCWRYLVEAPIGWDQSRRQSGSYGGGKKEFTRDERLLMIFGPRPTSVGEIWSGRVSIQDIWSGLKSVEDVDYPI